MRGVYRKIQFWVSGQVRTTSHATNRRLCFSISLCPSHTQVSRSEKPAKTERKILPESWRARSAIISCQVETEVSRSIYSMLLPKTNQPGLHICHPWLVMAMSGRQAVYSVHGQKKAKILEKLVARSSWPLLIPPCALHHWRCSTELKIMIDFSSCIVNIYWTTEWLQWLNYHSKACDTTAYIQTCDSSKGASVNNYCTGVPLRVPYHVTQYVPAAHLARKSRVNTGVPVDTESELRFCPSQVTLERLCCTNWGRILINYIIRWIAPECTCSFMAMCLLLRMSLMRN